VQETKIRSEQPQQCDSPKRIKVEGTRAGWQDWRVNPLPTASRHQGPKSNGESRAIKDKVRRRKSNDLESDKGREPQVANLVRLAGRA